MSQAWIYLCFFLSGFAGLVYEVVWSRLFVYTMGSSHLSIAVVVSVFMGGLALGSALGGVLADRSASPLRLYGWLVIGAGILSAAIIPAVHLLSPVLGAVYRLHDGSPSHPLFTAAKALVCGLTILVPTTCMGATLPVLARHLTRSVGEVGSRLGSLYAVNTFGAVAGAAIAGFILVPGLGLAGSLLLAAGVDVGAGVLVLALSRRQAAAGPASPAGAAAPRAAERGPEPRLPLSVRVAVLAFAVSGFANMCLQLGWTRALVVSIGNSTYSFSIIVGIFIFGLAAGGWISGLLADRLRHPGAAFGWLLIGTSAAAFMTIPWLGLSPASFAWKLGEAATEAARQAGPGELTGLLDFHSFLLRSAWEVGCMILPATLLMGMAFPIVGRIRSQGAQSLGRSVGFSYAANTAGAILGTAVTGFILMPLLGRVWALLYLAVGLSFLAGAGALAAALAGASGRRRLAHGTALAAAAAVLLAAAYWTRPYELRPESNPAGAASAPQDPAASGASAGGAAAGISGFYWHPVIFSLGAYINIASAQAYKNVEDYVRGQIAAWDPLYYRDGDDGSVAVLRNRKNGYLNLNISGKVDASAAKIFTFDLQTQLLMGHLALLVHPRPEETLNLGLGCGMSLGAMVSHAAVRQVDMAEISPEVVEAARLHFSEANKGSLDHAKVRSIIIGDGRNHLAHTARRYDVISSGPSNFWIAGIGNLFTQEYYRLLLDRLKPGGIVCQWIYGYSIRPEDYRLALRTILSVFPHVTVWSNSYGDTVFLSSKEPIVFDRERIAAALAEPAVQQDLAPIGITSPEDLFLYFRADGGKLGSWVGAGDVNRDLFPILEFSSPLGFFEKTTDIVPEMAAAGQSPLAPEMFLHYSAEQIQAAEKFRRSGLLAVRCVNRTYDRRFEDALGIYQELSKESDPWSLLCAGREIARVAQNLPDNALEAKLSILNRARRSQDTADLREAQRRAYQTLFEQASGALHAGNPAEAIRILDQGERDAGPDHAPFLSHWRGLALATQGKLPEAIAAIQQALQGWPAEAAATKGEAAHNLGRCLERASRLDEALAAYQQAGSLGFNAAIIGIARSRCFRALGNHAEAAREAAAAKAAASQTPALAAEAAAELARSRAASGDSSDALRLLEEANRLAPGRFAEELDRLRKS